MGRNTGVILKEPRYKNTARKKEEKARVLETTEKKWVEVVIELMEQGFSAKYIKQYIHDNKQKHERFGTKGIDNFYTQANRVISSQHATKIKEVQAIHVDRYNKQINELLSVTELPSPFGEEKSDEDGNGEFDDDLGDEGEGGFEDAVKAFFESRKKKIKAYNDALDTMERKETCLQMHSKSFTYVINEEFDVTVNNSEPKAPVFNPEKLTLEELVELLGYIQESRIDTNNVQSVTEMIREENVTEDVEAVVVATANIEAIKHEPIIIKERRETVPISDPAAKLKEALRKMTEKKLNTDNSNTGMIVITEEILKN